MFLQKFPNNYFCSIDQFQLQEESKPIGTGSFGIVKKAIHKYSKKIYAIKIIQLTQEMSQIQKLLLERQIAIHYQLEHPHIIKLWAVIKQQNKVYMIMDYAKNGNLFKYHKQIKKFTQSQSFHIFYQVLQAVEYMHKRDVFHRDLKPENILLDHNFNIYLCDFGWVAENINRKRTTFCGTYQYMAPQMLDQIPYDYKIDNWALGILLYQLNHGKAPFQGNSMNFIKEKLKKGAYEMKQSLSNQIKQLIMSILQFDPEKRISLKQMKQSLWIKKNKILSNNLLTKNFKDDNYQNETVKKKQKFHKKYRTLEEQDFLDKDQNKINFLQPTMASMKQNIKPKINFEEDKRKKKTSTSSSRHHLKTQSNQFFNMKVKQTMMMPSKLKVFDKELKKKKTFKK